MIFTCSTRFFRHVILLCAILLAIGPLVTLPLHPTLQPAGMGTATASAATKSTTTTAENARSESRHSYIHIDGDPSEWQGTPSAEENTGVVSKGELIWTDDPYDAKIETYEHGCYLDCELVELRLTADWDYLYLLARFADLTHDHITPPKPYIALAIDTDNSSTDTEMDFIGEWSETTLGNPEQYAEYNVEINHDDGVKVTTGDEWEPAGSCWFDSSYDSVEASIAMDKLGNASWMRFTVGIAMNDPGKGEPIELLGESDMVDAVSPIDTDLYDDDIDYSMGTSTVCPPNSPPSVESVQLMPEDPTSLTGLEVVYSFQDPDYYTEDRSEVRWFKNNILQSQYNDWRYISWGEMAEGQRWYCTIRPYDGYDYGELVTSPTVTIGNAPPGIMNMELFFDSEDLPPGTVTIRYILSDHDEDPCRIAVSYSTDQMTFYPATSADGGDGVHALEASTEGVSHIFLWNAKADLGSGEFSDIIVRITPEDENPGMPFECWPFDLTIDPNAPPSITDLELMGGDEGAGNGNGDNVWGATVSVSYQLLDDEGDQCAISVEYRVGDTDYRAATAAANGDGTSALTSSPSGILHTYIWDAKADLGSGEFADVALRLTPHDADDGEPGTTTSFGVDLQPPTLTAVEPHRTQTNRTVVLAVESDEDAYCRWSTTDQGYDAMSAADQFTNGEGGRLHSTTVTAPEGNTTYYISAVDPYGNTVKDTVTINVTVDPSGAGEDRIPPRIVTGPTILSTSDSAAVIVWTTDEPANSTLEYGTDTSYGSLETGRRATVQHSVTLTGLTPSTGYHVRVSATDAYGNGPTLSDDLSFTTNASGAGDTVDSDHDGVGDIADAFPTDPAASIDSDGDGAPDRWNDGRSAADSNSGLKLDAYPDDPERWEEATDAGSKADTDDDGGGLLGQLDDNALLLIIISVIVVSIIVMVVLNLKITSEKLLEKNYVKTVDRYEDVLEDLKELGVETNPFDDTLEQYKRKRP